MRRMPEKDLYSLLGVKPDSTQREIHKAYLSRIRIVHPDRFNRYEQPDDWKKANEMLAELNEAFSILKNPTTREEYDKSRSYSPHSNTSYQSSSSTSSTPPSSSSSSSSYSSSSFKQEHTSSSSYDFKSGELTAGYTRYSDLPKHIQEKLCRRQLDKEREQFQIKLASYFWNLLFTPASIVWLCYLFIDANGIKWKSETLLWYTGFTILSGVFTAYNLIYLIRWKRSILKPYFYITPLYFIKTEYDIVSFRPIWTLKDVSVTNNYKNGSYQNSDVILKFDGYNEHLRLYTKKDVETMYDLMNLFNEKIKSEFACRNYKYFSENDDFLGVSRATNIPKNVIISKGKKLSIYLISLLVCGIGFLSAIGMNNSYQDSRWVRHPTPDSYAPTRQKPSIPEQPLPNNGNVNLYTEAERIAPFEIKASAESHYLVKLVNSNNGTPVMTIFVRMGSTINVDVPIGSYEIRYASGEKWYGYEYLFGPDTSYNKADDIFNFQIEGDQVSGYTITLYKVPNGNLHTTPIKPTDF